MKRITLVLAAATAGAVVFGAGVAAARSGGGGEAVPRTHRIAPAAVNDSASETHFVAVTPCTLVDTPVKGQVLAPNATRTFQASGTTSFGQQGGKSTGCGIPAGAGAIQAVVTAAGATGAGTLRSSVGNIFATFMNYTASYDATGGGVIGLSGGTFRLRNITATTGVRVDVQGYFIAPIWAEVRSDGVLVAGSRVTSVTRVDIGRYEVIVDRNVANCGIAAQSTGVDQSDIWLQAIDNTVTVDVELPASSNTQDDDWFYLTVSC